MNEYTPDKWVVIEIKSPTETLYKVMASWYGGYLGSDSWKISSGIIDVKKTEYGYDFHNHSGSIYRCSEHDYGMSGYTTSVYSSFEDQNTDDMQIRIVDIEDVKKMAIFVPESK